MAQANVQDEDILSPYDDSFLQSMDDLFNIANDTPLRQELSTQTMSELHIEVDAFSSILNFSDDKLSDYMKEKIVQLHPHDNINNCNYRLYLLMRLLSGMPSSLNYWNVEDMANLISNIQRILPSVPSKLFQNEFIHFCQKYFATVEQFTTRVDFNTIHRWITSLMETIIASCEEQCTRENELYYILSFQFVQSLPYWYMRERKELYFRLCTIYLFQAPTSIIVKEKMSETIMHFYKLWMEKRSNDCMSLFLSNIVTLIDKHVIQYLLNERPIAHWNTFAIKDLARVEEWKNSTNHMIFIIEFIRKFAGEPEMLNHWNDYLRKLWSLDEFKLDHYVDIFTSINWAVPAFFDKMFNEKVPLDPFLSSQSICRLLQYLGSEQCKYFMELVEDMTERNYTNCPIVVLERMIRYPEWDENLLSCRTRIISDYIEEKTTEYTDDEKMAILQLNYHIADEVTEKLNILHLRRLSRERNLPLADLAFKKFCERLKDPDLHNFCDADINDETVIEYAKRLAEYSQIEKGNIETIWFKSPKAFSLIIGCEISKCKGNDEKRYKFISNIPHVWEDSIKLEEMAAKALAEQKYKFLLFLEETKLAEQLRILKEVVHGWCS